MTCAVKDVVLGPLIPFTAITHGCGVQGNHGLQGVRRQKETTGTSFAMHACTQFRLGKDPVIHIGGGG